MALNLAQFFTYFYENVPTAIYKTYCGIIRSYKKAIHNIDSINRASREYSPGEDGWYCTVVGLCY